MHGGNRIVSRAAAEALQSITGKHYDAEMSSSPDTLKFYQPEDMALLKRYRSALLMTSKGNIKNRIPGRCGSVYRTEFYGTGEETFLRWADVPPCRSEFRIQGGDPLGTGFGGPGYAIRTEVHPDATYSEGAVGMASAGKDTEGSQFFITHCPTPHLDGRYTVFGYTKDMDVVDKIQIGDTIISVKLME